MRTVYLDHQSSTPLLPEVLAVMQPYLSGAFGNPSSLHRQGLRARDALGRARAQAAGLIHTESDESIIFTSGGTEAANLAVKGVAYASQRRGKHIVLSAVEHPAVSQSVEFLETQGYRATRVGVDREGIVSSQAVADALEPDTILICVQQANHEVGSLQPIAEISAIANSRGIPLFVDAVASAGWIPIDVQKLGIGLLSVDPNRFYGPKGAGFLYRNRGVRLAGILHGGEQEGGRRAGTENVPGIAGAGQACELAVQEMSERWTHTARLQKELWSKMQAEADHLVLNGPDLGPKRISTNLNVSAECTEGEGQVLSLDMAGISVASGLSCISRSHKVSPILQAMGINAAVAQASILITLGMENTLEEMDYAAATFGKVVRRLRSLSPSYYAN